MLYLEETKESENVSVYINADTWPCVDLITSQSNQLPLSVLSESEFLSALCLSPHLWLSS